jgi:hypothetical protein
MAFQNLAKDKKICIGQMIQFPDNGTATAESSNEVVSAMLKKPTANTIIIIKLRKPWILRIVTR